METALTTFHRRRLRATGALLATLFAGGSVLAVAGTAAATEELPPDAIITQNFSSNFDIDPRIVGGEDAPEDEYPFLAHLEIVTPDGTGLCGGSLYAPDLVLTAAHCVAGTGSGPTDAITAQFGSINLDSADIVEYTSEHVYTGNISGIPNDWALVKLTEEVEGIDPLPLAPATEYTEDDIFTVAGWGLTVEGDNSSGSTILQEADVPFVTDEDCAAAYTDETGETALVAEAELCAGYIETGGIDACQGDSGGPLFRNEDPEDETSPYVQVGIVSWGNGCAKPGFPGIYTEVSTFADSIEAVANGENVPAEVADIEVTTTAGTPVEVVFEGTDADDDTLSYKVSVPEVGGEESLTTDDQENLTSVVYTPPADFVGTDTFQYIANDGHTDSAFATVTITVTEPEPTEEPTPTPTPTEGDDDGGDDDGDDEGDDDGEELPDTGSSTATGVTLAVALAVGGAALALVARRRIAGSNV